jgi:hypothetical protein
MFIRVLLAALVISVVAIAQAQVVTELTVTERAGIARKGEPVTNGVPLPKGLIKDTSELALRLPNGGEDLPACFTVINTWPEDGSARWVLLDTQVDAPAGQSAKFNLVKRTPLPKPPKPLPGKLDVKDAADSISVDTGAVSFTVSKKGFRLFESLSVDGKQVLGAPAGGLTAVVDGKSYTSGADATAEVTVEESTPMRVAILAKGKLASGGKTTFDYRVRIHAYRGRPEIKLVATVINKFGNRNNPNKVSDISLELPLAVIPEWRSLTRAFTFGTDKAEPVSGNVFKSAFVNVDSSDSFVLGGDAKGSGKCKSTKPLTLGWGDLTRGNVGIAAGVRRFWENWPKAIEATNNALIVHLYPSMQKEPLEMFTGMARTHEVLLVPHGQTTPAELQSRFVAFQRPLYAFASPKWMCRDTGAFGPLAEAASLAPGLYGEYQDQVAEFDKKMDNIFAQLAGPAQDSWKGRGGVTLDTYGWLNYGDTLHWIWLKEDGGVTDPPGSPWTIAWDANYYDMPHMACSHFARTGNLAVFDFFVDHSLHLADIDTIHYLPGLPNGGAGGSRRCPATNHVGFDPPEHKEVSPNYAFDHHKSESLFERYYLLGDRWALEAANELLAHAFDPKANGGKNGDYGGTRKPAHQILTLVAGYQCTGEKKYLTKAREVIDTGLARQKQFDGGLNKTANFTDGICAEAWSKYYLVTGDKDVLDGVVALEDFLGPREVAVGKRPTAGWGNAAMGAGLAYVKTGDKKYADYGMSCLKAKPGHLSKDSADMFRNAANFLGLVAQQTSH